MRNYILLLLLMFSNNIRAQVNIDFDGEECLFHNQLIFTEALYDCYGIDSLFNWIENQYRIVAIFDCDTLGNPLAVSLLRKEKIKKNNPHNDIYMEDEIPKLLQFFTQNNLQFKFCYWYEGFKSREETLEMIAQDLRYIYINEGRCRVRVLFSDKFFKSILRNHLDLRIKDKGT